LQKYAIDLNGNRVNIFEFVSENGEISNFFGFFLLIKREEIKRKRVYWAFHGSAFRA
jgi:hypothetical protein